MGKLQLGVTEDFVSNVLDRGVVSIKLLTISFDDYASGSGSGTLYWRGHNTIRFNKEDVTPSWEEYTSPANKTWRYIQVRMVP